MKKAILASGDTDIDLFSDSGDDDEGEGVSWEGEGEIAVAEVDLEYVENLRRESPLARRTDVYAELA